MSTYADESRILAIDHPHDADSVEHLAVNKTALMGINHPCTIYAVGVKMIVTTDASAATCIVTRRVTPASDTNAVAVATIYIPIAAAVGKIIYALITPQNANAGDELKYVFSNHGGSGMWRAWVDAVPRSETKANNTDFQLSVAV